ncbi:hypothetical protein AB0C98_29035 [Streptomyces sp. NPDC048558]|uniref:hypothetical protein n=1 Tax=Streptomyces sp. NPDC048558 TaxID=3155759 RepID=UPI0034178CAC
MTEFDIWVYRLDAGYQQGSDIVVYKVEAKGGAIGKISKHSEEVGSSYLMTVRDVRAEVPPGRAGLDDEKDAIWPPGLRPRAPGGDHPRRRPRREIPQQIPQRAGY